MALNCRCEKGHSYIQGDVYIPTYSLDEPVCPECREEWIKTKMCEIHHCLLKDCNICQSILHEKNYKTLNKFRKKTKIPRTVEVSEDMLIRAMKKAVEVGVLPKHPVDEETYLKHWSGMKEVLLAALND